MAQYFAKISFNTKVSVLSFALCCGVVSQHVKWICRDYEWLNVLQSFWFFIVETCVPFFYYSVLSFLYELIKVANGEKNYNHG